MTSPETCYMCDAKSTSREHVPPRCFFPSAKDSLSGKNFRRNLITVPSCDIHNSQKSGDDLYLLHIISSAYQSNSEGLKIFKKRIEKTIDNRPHLLKTFFSQSEEFYVNGQSTLAIDLDVQRFDNGMKCMANAIYFAHLKNKWNEPLEILAPSLRYSSKIPNYQAGNNYLKNVAEPFDAGVHKYGENQDIFFYQFINGALPEHKLLRMVFYQGFVVLAIPIKWKEYILNRADHINS
jgi:hypothetical protein